MALLSLARAPGGDGSLGAAWLGWLGFRLGLGWLRLGSGLGRDRFCLGLGGWLGFRLFFPLENPTHRADDKGEGLDKNEIGQAK